MDAFNDHRGEWDTRLESCEELNEFRTENTRVHRLVTNPHIVGMKPREFIEKRVFLKKADLFEGAWKISEDKYYGYVSSVPDQLYQEDHDKFVRAHTLIGMHRIGRLEKGGCYL